MKRPLVVALLVTTALAPRSLRAQAAVNGQIQITEKPGETTSDLASAVAWLEPANGAAVKVEPTNTSMALHGRQFNPGVRIVTAGSRIDFPNQDPFSHNVFTKAPAGPFDSEVYGRGRTRSNVFAQAAVYPLYCNIHPKMTGFVVAVRTPWFAQAGDDGKFTIEHVPAGTYTLHLWHPRASEVTQALVVPSTGLDALKFDLDARGYKFVPHKNKYGQDYTNVAGDRY